MSSNQQSTVEWVAHEDRVPNCASEGCYEQAHAVREDKFLCAGCAMDYDANHPDDDDEVETIEPEEPPCDRCGSNRDCPEMGKHTLFESNTEPGVWLCRCCVAAEDEAADTD